jgi:arginine:agmatine antiporter
MHGGGGKKMGLVAASSLVVTNMVGTGLFLLPSSLATIGSISIWGWVVSAIGATALGLVFAHLGMVDPKAGGPYAYARDHMGPYAAFQTNTLYWIANVIGNVAIAVSVTGYLAVFFPVLANPWLSNACTALVIWTFVWLNTRGANTVGRFTTFTTAAGIIPIAVIGLLGWHWFNAQTFMQGWNPEARAPAAAITSSASIALWAFLGVESAAVSAGVIENPRRNVPLATLIGLAVSTLIYVACCAVIMGILPNETLRTSHAPFADAAMVMFGKGAALIISLAAILKAAGSLTGWMLIVAQSAQAAAGDGMFPRAFAVTNDQGMPVRNLVITGLLMTGLLMLTISPDVATQFNRITNATVVLMSVPYIYSVVAMWRLNSRLDMPVRRRRALVGIGLVAALFCVGVIVGQSDELNRNALLVLLLVTPLYAFIHRPSAPAEVRPAGADS